LKNFKQPSGRHNSQPLYEPSNGTQGLRVVVDDLILAQDERQTEILDLLHGLLTHSLITSWLCDGELVEDTEAAARASSRSTARCDWIEVSTAEPDAHVTHNVRYVENNRPHLGAVSGDVGRGEVARNEPTYAHLDPDEASVRRNADARLLGAADAVGADLLVTDRRFLVDGHWFASLRPLACTPEEAVALIGQYLRLRGVYPGWSGRGGGISLTFNKGLYFWVGTRALLPEGWRWFSHCVAADGGSSTSDMTLLAQSVLQRVERTLVARDALRWHLTLPQNNDVADEALAQVDHILVDLVGAFDALARVAHRVFRLESSEYASGWQKDAWLTKVQDQAPGLAAVMAARTLGGDLFEVMRLLRNTVHGAGLQAMGLSRMTGRRQRTVVSLPVGETARLMTVLERRNWSEAWGVTEFEDGRFYVSPEQLVEHMLKTAIPVLNDLMRETPVESLLNLPGRYTGPAEEDDPGDAFAVRHQRSVMYQLGLGIGT
jgi:hypothetical protein